MKTLDWFQKTMLLLMVTSLALMPWAYVDGIAYRHLRDAETAQAQFEGLRDNRKVRDCVRHVGAVANVVSGQLWTYDSADRIFDYCMKNEGGSL